MRLATVGSCALSAALVMLLGCEPSVPSAPDSQASVESGTGFLKMATEVTEAPPPAASIKMLSTVNAKLKAAGKNYRVVMMEYITAPGSGQFGSTVFAKDVGNKQLPYHFNADFFAFPRVITYAVDVKQGAANGGLSNADTEPAIDRAMSTWDKVIDSGLLLSKVSAQGEDIGSVQKALGFKGTGGYVADVNHAGWLPAAFFDKVDPPNGSESILGVTFTFIYVDDGDNPIDMNGDHKYDAAFREIYYNNAFAWTNDRVDFTSPLIDVESIVLHESGHGLSQAHFGALFFDGNGTTTPTLQHLHFSPRAVMNAIYWETQRDLLGSDIAGHNSIWATWPSK